MIALFLLGELSSERFSEGIRIALDAASQTETLITAADLSDAGQNRARRAILAATRGYGEIRDVFENFPAHVRWVRAMLALGELAQRGGVSGRHRTDHGPVGSLKTFRRAPGTVREGEILSIGQTSTVSTVMPGHS